MLRKFILNKQEYIDRLLNTLEKIDLDDEFIKDLETEQEMLNSDAKSIDSDEGELLNDDNDDDQMDDQMEVQSPSQDHSAWIDQPQIDRSAFPFTADSGVNANLQDNIPVAGIF